MRQNTRSVRRRSVGILALLAAGGVAFSGGLGAKDEGTTRAFLVYKSVVALHYGPLESDCPEGFERTVEENFLASISPAERERLAKPENASEYNRRWKNDVITGPGGENVCNNPKSFLSDPKHPPHRGVQSKVSYGLNLDGTSDGRATSATCAHQKFEGLNGEGAVDNQLYRALGCHKSTRGGGEKVQGEKHASSELEPYMIEIRGLDNVQNDDSVEVGVYSTEDAIISSQLGTPSAYQSLHISANPLWRNEVKGRVVNGEVLTDVIPRLTLHWLMPTWGALGVNYSHEFMRARLKLRLEPDGGVSGLLAGYRPLGNIMTNSYCCRGTASTANRDCASEYKTFMQMADGDPDPETGQCTTISAAHKVVGVPVFVIHDQRGNR